MADRCYAAIAHLTRTPRGRLPWAPTYGSLFHLYRTQQINAGDRAFLEDDHRGSLANWVPDIHLVEMSFVYLENEGGDDETLDVRMAWGIPDATEVGARGITVPRFAFGPVAQTVSI